MREVVPLGDRAHPLQPGAAGLDPAGGAEAAMVVWGQLLSGQDVVVEQPAVVDDARDHLDAGARGGIEAQLARPRLERVEDHHRPVDQVAETLEAVDQVEREAVGRAGGDADHPRQATLAQRRHPAPHGLQV